MGTATARVNVDIIGQDNTGAALAAASRNIQMLRKGIASTSAQLREFGATSKTAMRGDMISAYTRKLEIARAKYNPLFAALQKYKIYVQEVRAAHATGAISIKEMTAAIARERTATLATTRALREAGRATTALGVKAEVTSAQIMKMNSSAAKSGAHGGHGRGMMVGMFVGMAAIMAGGAAISALTGFEDAMAAVKGVTGATAVEMKSLTAVAKELGATTEFTASQVAEGMKFLAMAGFSAAKTVAVIPQIVDLATAGQMDLAQAADLTTNIMTAFRMGADQAGLAVDILSTIATSANTNIVQLAEAVKYVGTVSSSLGIGLGETAAAIGVLSNAGMQATLAGTSLRRSLAKLLDITPKSANAIKDLGLNIDDLNPKANTLVEIINKLADAGMDIEDAAKIFGIRGGPAMQSLVDQVDKLNELTAATEDVAEATKTLADIMRDTLLGEFRQVASAAEAATLALGDEGLVASLRYTAGFFKDMFRFIVKNGPAVWAIISGLTGALVTYAIAAKGAALATGLFTGALALLTSPIGMPAAIVGALVGGFVLLRSTINRTRDATVDYIEAASKIEGLNNRIANSSAGLTDALRLEAFASLAAAGAALQNAKADLIAEQAYLSRQSANARMAAAVNENFGNNNLSDPLLIGFNNAMAESLKNIQTIQTAIDRLTMEKAVLVYGVRAQTSVQAATEAVNNLGGTLSATNNNALDLMSGIRGAGVEISDWAKSLTSAFSGVGSEMMKVLRGTGTFAEKMTGIFDVLISRVQKFADTLLDQALNAGLSTLFNAIFPSGGAGIGGLGSFFSPASLGSFGNSNIIGGGLSLASGGYTGGGPLNQAAGIVHGQEYVFSAAATRQIGVPSLNAMNQRGALPANANNQRAANGNGDKTIIINNSITINTPDIGSFRQSEQQIAARLAQMTRRGARNL